MCQFLNEPDNTNSTIYKQYMDCVDSCQRMGAELAELEDLLFDDPDLEGEELVDCVKELLEIKWIYKDLCR